MPILGIVASSKLGAPSAPVAGYSLWLDASDTSTITVSGTSVTQWTDKSTNAYTFSQATGSLQPKSGTRTINSKNVLDFDGDILVSNQSAATYKFTTDGDASFFIVALHDSYSGDSRTFMANNEAGSGAVGFFWTTTTGGRLAFALYRGVSGTAAIDGGFTNPIVSTGTAFVNSLLTDPANGTAANRLYNRLNKGTVYNNNTATSAPSTADPDYTLKIGNYSAGDPGSAFDGAIGEILLYNTKLSDTDRDSNVDYLMAKWGIV